MERDRLCGKIGLRCTERHRRRNTKIFREVLADDFSLEPRILIRPPKGSSVFPLTCIRAAQRDRSGGTRGTKGLFNPQGVAKFGARRNSRHLFSKRRKEGEPGYHTCNSLTIHVKPSLTRWRLYLPGYNILSYSK